MINSDLTLVSPYCNFPHICLISNCNENYCSKSYTRLFMFDNFINIRSIRLFSHVTNQNEPDDNYLSQHLWLHPEGPVRTTHGLKQGLSHLCVQRVIWTRRTLFFDSLDTQKFMSEFAEDGFS